MHWVGWQRQSQSVWSGKWVSRSSWKLCVLSHLRWTYAWQRLLGGTSQLGRWFDQGWLPPQSNLRRSSCSWQMTFMRLSGPLPTSWACSSRVGCAWSLACDQIWAHLKFWSSRAAGAGSLDLDSSSLAPDYYFIVARFALFFTITVVAKLQQRPVDDFAQVRPRLLVPPYWSADSASDSAASCR